MALEHDGVSVRYACKCGQLGPVRALFFSDLSQKPVCRRPSCALEEFESFYCGHLLVNLPSKEASLYQNRSSRCFSCPTCASVLATAFHEAKRRYFFLCAHCRWDSLELGLEDEDPDTLVMSAIVREREAAQEDVFHTLLSHYSSAPARPVKVHGVSQGVGLLSIADSMKELQREQQMKKFRLHRMAEMGGWRYEQLQDKMYEREQWLLDQRRESEWPQLAAQLAALPAPCVSNQDAPELLMRFAQLGDMGEVSTLQQRLLHPLEQPREASKVFLSRPPLRAKRTWRCIESIEKGSAGILVKPQISPMSGDSSLPVSTSWFKKANLAVHYLPIVTFQHLPRRSQGSDAIEVVLFVENPLDDPIRLVLREWSGDAGQDDGFEENSQVLGYCRLLLCRSN